MRPRNVLYVIVALLVIGVGAWWIFRSAASSETVSNAELAVQPVASTTEEIVVTAEATTTTATTTATTTPAKKATTPAKPTTVAGIVASIGTASKFASWFQSTGVANQVSGKGPYTVFVPTNGAFTLVKQSDVNNLTAAQKKRLVQYHVVSGRAIDPDAIESGTIQSLSKDMLNFEVRDADEIARVNSAIIVESYPAKNGIVHVINNVLIPPK